MSLNALMIVAAQAFRLVIKLDVDPIAKFTEFDANHHRWFRQGH